MFWFLLARAAVLVVEQFGVLVPALAHGLILCALIYTYGHISGAQVNPAVTLGLTIGGKQDPTKSAYFIVAQFIGGIIAAIALVGVFPPDNAGVAAFLGDSAYNYGQTRGFLTPDSVWTAAAYEAILTFFLVSAVMQAAAFGRAGKLAGVAIGFTLAASILAGGPATGASLNPGPHLWARLDRRRHVIRPALPCRHIRRRHNRRPRAGTGPEFRRVSVAKEGA